MPKQTEIKQKELQEFWEWCGLVWVGNSPQPEVANSCEAMVIDKPICGWYSPDYLKGTSKLISLRKTPVLDLNNLFKYAVPTLRDVGIDCHDAVLTEWVVGLTGDYEKDTLALYQAIQKARNLT